MKIALYGGSFDPVHNAHIALAEACREQAGVDEVWFLVTPQNPWKQDRHLSPDRHRLRMVQLAIEGHEGLVASDYEFRLEKPTYSYITLRHLREDYPQHEFILLVGGDNWAQFDHWAHYEEILEHHTVAVYPRHGNPIGMSKAVESLHPSFFMLHFPFLAVSSTLVRQHVAAHEAIDGLVPPEVEKYISDNHLYNS